MSGEPAAAMPGQPSAVAVVVAAGRGERLGVPAKVLVPLGGRPMLAYVLDALQSAATVVQTVLVVGPHTRDAVAALVAGGSWAMPFSLVEGGRRRQDSVAAGLAAVPAGADVVLVHDGARPLAPPALFDRCAAVAWETEAAIVAVPVADTLKRVVAGRVAATIDRGNLWAAQTPQAFRREHIAALIARCAGAAVTDEAGLCQALGIPVAVVPGLASNMKVTHPEDVAVAEALLSATAPALADCPSLREPSSRAAGAATADGEAVSLERRSSTRGERAETISARVGIGYDVHRFVAGRPLVLGGVAIPHERGLEGHSDADVLLHAIADALLGAAALGDIGHHFPPSDPRFAGADSRRLLAEVVRLLAAAGYAPGNVDATVVAEAPRIAPHVPAMRASIADCLGLPEEAVSIKATTNEAMGFVGRGEGIAALATAGIGRRQTADGRRQTADGSR